jgi:hypothetical protein
MAEYEKLLQELRDHGEDDLAEQLEEFKSGRSGAAEGGRIEPFDVGGWSMERKLRFRDEHPDEWESLKRGQTVTV